MKKNKLSSFITRLKKEEERKTVVIIDGHNLMFRTVNIANSINGPEEDFNTWKYFMLHNVMDYVKQFKPDQLIIAFDDRNYWRKDYYPEYKAHRKAARAKSAIDFSKFFPIANDFNEELSQALDNVYFLKKDKCEADDIIAVLTTDVFQDWNVINISTDQDFHQLMENDNYKQYEPIKKRFSSCLNPKTALQIKILAGDRKDNIPGVKPRCGPATAQKMLDSGLDEIFAEDSTIEENYTRNKVLIDFAMIPHDIRQCIIDEYKNYKIDSYNGRKVYKFMMKHEIGGMLENMQTFRDNMSRLA